MFTPLPRVFQPIVWFLGCLLAACASNKTPYISTLTQPEPDALPPSARYTAVRMTLARELARHPDVHEFYLCQAPRQVEALQRDLPAFRLIHASETYTSPVEGWPVAWSHRNSDDELATRVIVDILSETPAQIVARVYVGYQYPNMEEAIYTLRRIGKSWRITNMRRSPKIEI